MPSKLIKEIMANFNDNPLIDDVKKCKIFEIDKQMVKFGCLPLLLQSPSINKYRFKFIQSEEYSYNFITKNVDHKLNLISENGMLAIERKEFFRLANATRKIERYFTLSFKKGNGKFKVQLSKFCIVKNNVPIALGVCNKLSDFEIDITDNPKEMSDCIYQKIINGLEFLLSIDLLLRHSGRIIGESLGREVAQEIVVI